MNRSALAATAASVALFAGATVFLMAPASLPEDRLAVVIDTTTTNDPATRCVDGRDAIASVLGAGRRDLVVDARFTGSRATGHEARSIAPLLHRRVPGMVDGPKAAPTLPAEFEAACSTVPATTESPIFRAVRAALGDLRVHAAPGRRLFLVVRTDGLEEEDAALIQRLRGDVGPVEPRLDNAGVTVRFCGLSRRTGATWLGRAAPDFVRIEAEWRAEFTESESIRFTSTCT